MKSVILALVISLSGQLQASIFSSKNYIESPEYKECAANAQRADPSDEEIAKTIILLNQMAEGQKPGFTAYQNFFDPRVWKGLTPESAKIWRGHLKDSCVLSAKKSADDDYSKLKQASSNLLDKIISEKSQNIDRAKAECRRLADDYGVAVQELNRSAISFESGEKPTQPPLPDKTEANPLFMALAPQRDLANAVSDLINQGCVLPEGESDIVKVGLTSLRTIELALNAVGSVPSQVGMIASAMTAAARLGVAVYSTFHKTDLEKLIRGKWDLEKDEDYMEVLCEFRTVLNFFDERDFGWVRFKIGDFDEPVKEYNRIQDRSAEIDKQLKESDVANVKEFYQAKETLKSTIESLKTTTKDIKDADEKCHKFQILLDSKEDSTNRVPQLLEAMARRLNCRQLESPTSSVRQFCGNWNEIQQSYLTQNFRCIDKVESRDRFNRLVESLWSLASYVSTQDSKKFETLPSNAAKVKKYWDLVREKEQLESQQKAIMGKFQSMVLPHERHTIRRKLELVGTELFGKRLKNFRDAKQENLEMSLSEGEDLLKRVEKSKSPQSCLYLDLAKEKLEVALAQFSSMGIMCYYLTKPLPPPVHSENHVTTFIPEANWKLVQDFCPEQPNNPLGKPNDSNDTQNYCELQARFQILSKEYQCSH